MTTGPRSEVPGTGMGLGYDPVDASETTAEQLAKRGPLPPEKDDGARNQIAGEENVGAEVLERRERAADERSEEQ